MLDFRFPVRRNAFPRAFHFCCREFTFSSCDVDFGLSSSTSDSASSNLAPSTSTHHYHFHASPLPTHTRDIRAPFLVTSNFEVVAAFFEGIREVLGGFGHTDGVGVDGDRVGIIDGDSARGDVDHASLDDANLGRNCGRSPKSYQGGAIALSSSSNGYYA